ncbi:MAG: MFS transporter [Nevskia sp.]|nr:MFS transporter [Nevskia sp.]
MNETVSPAVTRDAAARRAAVRGGFYPWLVVGLLCVAQILSFADRQVLNLMVAPIRHDLAISDTQISLLMGFSFALFYTVCGIPLARIADRGNRRWLITAGALAWSLATASCGLAQRYAHLLAARIGVGVGEATLSPTAFSLITDYFPPSRRATAQSVYGLGTYVGAGLAFLLGGAVIHFASRHGALTLPLIGEVRPWQSVFLILGGAGTAFGLLLLLIREPASGERGGPTQAPGLWHALRGHRKTLIYHHLGFAMTAFAGYSSAAWLPSYFIRVRHWTPVEVGLVYGGAVAVFGALGVVAGGLLADRWGRRGQTDATLRVGVWASLLAIPCTAALLPVQGLAPTALLLAVAVFLFSMPLGAAVAGLHEIVPPAARAQASAVYLFVLNLVGLGFGPTAVALVTDYVFRDDRAVGASLVLVCGTALALAALLLRLGLEPYRRSYARQRAAE